MIYYLISTRVCHNLYVLNITKCGSREKVEEAWYNKYHYIKNDIRLNFIQELSKTEYQIMKSHILKL